MYNKVYNNENSTGQWFEHKFCTFLLHLTDFINCQSIAITQVYDYVSMVRWLNLTFDPYDNVWKYICKYG